MGKKQHQKDKLYITCSEWSKLYGGKAANEVNRSKYRRLPFNCCRNILPFLKKHKINPVTGKKMKASELIKLNFHENGAGKYHCPVTYKVFNENTHIVAIKGTGNVYSYDAVERLNLKSDSFHDLLTNEPFEKCDIIEIQNPSNLHKFNISAFYHVKNAEEKAANHETRETLEALADAKLDVRDYMFKNKKEEADDGPVKDKYNTANYSTGSAAHSLTSTVMEPSVKVEAAVLADDVVRYKYVTKKGYVRLITTHGMINLELHCDTVPKTCENFIRLCESGYYDDTEFHRLIKHFIIQGGDPTGTGTGGDSCWGGPFNDEFVTKYSHDSRGILSMANAGPNTNKSQFFITFRTCKHLNKKHTIFGKVVGGLDTLNKVEWIPTDDADKPLEKISIITTKVFVNPYKEVDDMLIEERGKLKKEAEAGDKKGEKTVMLNGVEIKIKPGNRREEEELEERLRKEERISSDGVSSHRDGIGKFISNKMLHSEAKTGSTDNQSIQSELAKKRRKCIMGNFGDFSSW